MSDSSSGNIVTLQIGTYSNYIGSHIFNLQDPGENPNEEVNHGIIWNERQSLQRHPIWTPRVIIFDLKDNYVSGRATQFLSSLEQGTAKLEEGILWEGPVSSVDHRQNHPRVNTIGGGGTNNENRVEKNEGEGTKITGDNRIPEKVSVAGETPGINSGKTQQRGVGEWERVPEIKTWVDYTQWKLHRPHQNRFSVPNFSHNGTLGVLSNYGQGFEIYKSVEETITDAVRVYAEDSDYFQGFHILVDEQNGFGGIASGILEHISDEYDKKTSLCFGCSQPLVAGGREEQFPDFMLRTLNTSLTWNSFNLHSSVFSSIGLSNNLFQPNPQPVQLPHINYDPASPYMSSSILAATLDTFTMPYRLKDPRISLREVASLLNAYNHKMMAVGAAFPASILNEITLFDALNDRGLTSILTCVTPGVDLQLDKNIGNFFIPRGFHADQVIKRDEGGGRLEGLQRERQGRGITDAESCLQLYSQEAFHKSVNVVKSVRTPFKVSHPFPVLFDPRSLHSVHSSVVTPSFGQNTVRRVWEMPMMASGHNSLDVGRVLESLVDVHGGRNFSSSRAVLRDHLGMEWDDYEECLNNLRTLRESYLPDTL